VRAIALAILACMLLAGCGTHGADSAMVLAGMTTQVPTTATPPEHPPGNAGVVFADNPSIVNSHPMPFDSWSLLGSGDVVELHFTVGSPDCSGVHATASETTDSVVVELRTGTLPEAVGRMCTMIAVFGSLDVPLQTPLGGRQVLNVS
jgi:hypothetical protein